MNSNDIVPLGALGRREVLAAGAGAAALGLLTSLVDACGVARAPLPESHVPCREPTTADERTFVAIADTVVPGAATDPSGTPGAIEGCVLNLASDPSLPVAPLVSFLVTLADQRAQNAYARNFVDLSLDERTTVLAAAVQELPLLSLAFKFFRAAHYNGLYNDVGPRSLGYPGGNLGYVDDPEFSFRRPVSRERTPDGNMP